MTKLQYYENNGALHKKIAAVEYDSNGILVSNPEASGFETVYVYDSWGNLTSETDPLGHSIVTAYDEQYVYPVRIDDRNGRSSYVTFDPIGNLISKKDAEGYVSGFEYNGYGQVTKITDALGKETRFEYDVNRRLKKTFDPDGGVIENVYDIARDLVDGAKVIRKIDQLGKSEYYTYDKVGNVATKKDRNGNVTKYEYDGLNRLVAEYDPFGNYVFNDYDGNGNIVATFDRIRTTSLPDGHKTAIEYDKANRKTRIIDRRTKPTRFTYDLNGNIISQIKTLGTQDIFTLFTYDALNRPVTKTLAQGTADERTYSYRYDILGRMVKEIEPLQNYKAYTYDNNGNKTKVEYFDRTGVKLKEESFSYDKRNLLIKRTDARGKEWKSEYDTVGRKTRVIDPAGKHVSYVYDAVGNLCYVIDQKGNITEHTYDLANHRIETIDPLNRITSYRYDPNGNLVGVTDPNGNETIIYYDASNRKIAVEDALHNSTTFDYDENGNLIAQTDPLGRVTRLEYNENDQVLKVKDPPGYSNWGDTFITKTYDDLGRLQDFKDQLNHTTRTNYNFVNQKKEVIEALGAGGVDEAMTSYLYDLNGNLYTMTNAKPVNFQFRYDDLNQLRYAYDGNGTTFVEYQYDENGNVRHETRRDGATVITRIYDDLNRLIELRRGGDQGALLQSFQYDELSRMTQAVDYNEGKATHTVQFEYDELNRVKAEVQDGVRVTRDFDANGNPIRLGYPSGKELVREYDALNRTSLIKDSGGDVATFDYWQDGKPKTVAYANGITLNLSYNEVGLEEVREYVKTSSIYKLTTDTYAKDRTVTKELEAYGGPTVTRDYTYDPQDRIKSEKKNSTTIGTWYYDKVGNWTSTTQNKPSESRSVDNDNQYTSITGITPLVYDVHGNLSTSGTSGYVYDWKNRLTEVWDGGVKVAEYTYDALNRRVSKSTPVTSGVTTYVYDNAQVIEEHEQGVFKRAYVYGQYVDDPIMMESGGQHYYYLKDRQYGIRSITDSAGNEVERYEYTAFGKRTVYNNDGGSWVLAQESQVGNSNGFTGRHWDKESGLWYYRNRMYSPVLGRFLQRDPSGYVDGVNLYAYVKNNPMIYLDPQGLTKQNISYYTPSPTPATPTWQAPIVEPVQPQSVVQQPLPVSVPISNISSLGYEDAPEAGGKKCLDGGCMQPSVASPDKTVYRMDYEAHFHEDIASRVSVSSDYGPREFKGEPDFHGGVDLKYWQNAPWGMDFYDPSGRGGQIIGIGAEKTGLLYRPSGFSKASYLYYDHAVLPPGMTLRPGEVINVAPGARIGISAPVGRRETQSALIHVELVTDGKSYNPNFMFIRNKD